MEPLSDGWHEKCFYFRVTGPLGPGWSVWVYVIQGEVKGVAWDRGEV